MSGGVVQRPVLMSATLAFIMAMQLAGITVDIMDNSATERACQAQVVYGLAGCYLPASDTIILNTRYRWLWPTVVPHEYAHRVTVREHLENELSRYFMDEEHMAESYSVYWNNPAQYRREHPAQAAWFAERFAFVSFSPPGE